MARVVGDDLSAGRGERPERLVLGPTSPEEALVRAGLVTADQLREAVAEHSRTKRPLGRVLVERGFVDEPRLPLVYSLLTGLPAVDLYERTIDAGAVALVPESFARRHAVVALGFDGDAVVVAVADPQNVVLIDDLRMLTRRDVKLVVASRTQIEEVIGRLRTLDPAEAEIAHEPEPTTDDLAVQADSAPVVRFVNQLLADAVQQRASDVHLEPEERELRVRYRIDGVLHDVAQIPRSQQHALVSRLKVMADANIAERRLPQDGRVSLTLGGQPVDIRVSTLPSVWGEDVVLRILDRSASMLTLDDLGYADAVLDRVRGGVARSSGLVLVTGPTGCGKSTTLYAALNLLNDPTKKIITVEDPVEYRLPRVRQIQVHPHIGLGFASALRSILRSDPDIVMIGEIRDRETAAIAIQAAMTGHLVLATLHTNDAASAPTRLVDMGIEPFLVSSALSCVVAQRLARRLCPRCSATTRLDPSEAWHPLWRDQPPTAVRVPVGCGYCSQSGYRGRVAVAEALVCTPEVTRLVAERPATDELLALALDQGMVPLVEDGVAKVRAGVTTLEEIVRVTT